MQRERDYRRLVMAAEPRPFWLDRPEAPPVRERLRGEAANGDHLDLNGGLWYEVRVSG